MAISFKGAHFSIEIILTGALAMEFVEFVGIPQVLKHGLRRSQAVAAMA